MRFKTWIVMAGALNLAGCASGGLGGILGGVLGGNNNEVTGVVRSIDTRNQTITIRDGGQDAVVSYDNRTQVTFEGRSYRVTDIEYGDEVRARTQSGGNGYYTDLIEVTRSVSSNNSTAGEQLFDGTVRSVDRTYGTFVVDDRNYGRVIVSMPYRATSTDSYRFEALRSGDRVRFYGRVVTNGRVDLLRFY